MREPGGRAYRALLRMFPRRFRERNSTAMGQLFAEMRAAWEEERGRVGPRFWAALTWDTACAATAEWFSLLGDTIRPDSASTVDLSQTRHRLDHRRLCRHHKTLARRQCHR